MPPRDAPWPPGSPCWVELAVNDVARAASFYEGLFGWELGDEGGGGRVVARLGGGPVGAVGPAGGGVPTGWLTHFAVASLEDGLDDVQDAGGEVLARNFPRGDAGRAAVARDPFGATFGLWEQSGSEGIGTVGQHGAPCWNELHTRRYAEAQDFYAQVMGWTYVEIGDGAPLVYSVLRPMGEPDAAGGLCDDAALGVPAGAPSHWLTWFGVDDADEAAREVDALGGTVTVEPRDSPFGRMVVVSGACGEMLGLIGPDGAG